MKGESFGFVFSDAEVYLRVREGGMCVLDEAGKYRRGGMVIYLYRLLWLQWLWISMS